MLDRDDSPTTAIDGAADSAPETETASATASHEPAALPNAAASQARRMRLGQLARGVLLLVVAASFAFPPVRALGGQFLSIFRVQKVQTITVTQQDVDQLSQAIESGKGHVSLEQLGDVWVDGAAPEPKRSSLASAQATVDFPILVPAGMTATPTVMLQPATTIKFKLNVDNVNALLESYGTTKTFSRDIDGKVFEVRIPAIVGIVYGDRADTVATSRDMMSEVPDETTIDPSNGTVVVQTRGPELVVPSGVDALALRDVLLNLPFLPDNIRKQLASVQDWQHTLLVPNVDGSTKDIQLNGMAAVVMSPKIDPDDPQPEESPVAVMWHKDGVVYAVAGVGGEAKILKVAESIAR